MNPFAPVKWPYEVEVDADSQFIKKVKRWPGQRICAEIVRVRYDEVTISELGDNT